MKVFNIMRERERGIDDPVSKDTALPKERKTQTERGTGETEKQTDRQRGQEREREIEREVIWKTHYKAFHRDSTSSLFNQRENEQ